MIVTLSPGRCAADLSPAGRGGDCLKDVLSHLVCVNRSERAAAASITSVPRSLASAVSPLLAGYLLSVSSFGWPLIVAGALKIAYDLLLLVNFRSVRPPEEVAAGN